MSKRDLARGEDIGLQMIPMFKECTKISEDPVHFWAGLISALTGIAVAEIGKDAVHVLLSAAAGVGEQIQKANTQ